MYKTKGDDKCTTISPDLETQPTACWFTVRNNNNDRVNNASLMRRLQTINLTQPYPACKEAIFILKTTNTPIRMRTTRTSNLETQPITCWFTVHNKNDDLAHNASLMQGLQIVNLSEPYPACQEAIFILKPQTPRSERESLLRCQHEII